MRFAILFSVLSLLAASACGGGKDKDKESGLRWECYAEAAYGTCECVGLRPGDELIKSGVEVESCAGYEVCFSYYDEFFEEQRCDCGDAAFMPPDEDVSDVAMETSCPAE